MTFPELTLNINLAAIVENYKIIEKTIGKNVDIGAIVKANAYGLGANKIVPLLSKAGCHIFFVATVEEALQIREVTLSDKIFVLAGIKQGQESIFFSENILPVLNTIEQIKLWHNFCLRKRRKMGCIIAIDSGMNRLGLNYHSGLEFLKNNYKELAQDMDISMLLSHFTCSDQPNHPMNQEQYLMMCRLKKILPSECKISLANSSAIFSSKDYHFDVVRPGISLYGCSASEKNHNLKNVITISAQIIQIREVEEDGTVGYGATHHIKKGSTLATVAIGYADGYLRSLTSNMYCYIADIKVPVVGRVSMDSIVLDVSSVPKKELHKDTEVEIVNDYFTIDDLANSSERLSYELLIYFGNSLRCKKNYIGG
jgi:alanine racemase